MKYLSLLILLLCNSALAANQVSSVIRQYDDGDTQVTSPSIDVNGTAYHDQLKVGAGWAADIVSSASADVRSFGSKGQQSRIGDRRTEYDLNSELSIPDGTLSIAYVQSDENDYHSKLVSAGGTREFFAKNTVIGFTFNNGQDTIEASGQPSFHQSMNNQGYGISLTQLLTRKSLINFIYDFRVENGYDASPYRKAVFVDASNHATPQPENHPMTRNRNAFAVKYNWFADSIRTSFSTTDRIYYDSWGVFSNTVEQKINHDFSRWFNAALIGRFYHQEAANFYKPYYDSANPGPFWTGNKTLASFDSYLAGVRPTVKFADDFEVFLKYEVYTDLYKNATDQLDLSNVAAAKLIVINASIYGLGINAKF
jgi:hypothetical protein